MATRTARNGAGGLRRAVRSTCCAPALVISTPNCTVVGVASRSDQTYRVLKMMDGDPLCSVPMKCHDSNGADAMWHASAVPGTASGSDMNAASSLIGVSEVSVTDQRFSDTCEKADAATSG